jgi:hypothetical protein
MHAKFVRMCVKGAGHSEDLCIDGRIILKWILEKWGPIAVTCEHGERCDFLFSRW